MSRHVMFDPSLQSSTPLNPLGQIHWDSQGRLYRYGIANGAQTAGEVSQSTKDPTAAGAWDFTPMTTTTVNSQVWHLGVPNIAMTDNYYGWFFCGFGDYEIVVANAVSANTVLTSTATAGEVGTGGTPCDGLENIDAGVTSTRVTVMAFGLMTVGLTAAYD